MPAQFREHVVFRVWACNQRGRASPKPRPPLGVAHGEIEHFVAVAASDFGYFHRFSGKQAGCRDRDAATKSKQALFDSRFQQEIGAGIRHRNPRDAALSAKVGSPLAAIGRILDQTTLLPIPAAVIILKVVGTL